MYGGVVPASPRTRTRQEHWHYVTLWHYVSLPGDVDTDIMCLCRVIGALTKWPSTILGWFHGIPPPTNPASWQRAHLGVGAGLTPLVITGIILTATCYRSQTAATGAASVRYADKRVGGDCGEGAVRHWYMCQQPPEARGDTGVINNELPFKSRRTTDVQFEETHCKLNI